MRAYSIALFFIIFGAVIGMINDMAIYDQSMPEHNVGLSDADVNEITDGIQNDGSNPVSYITLPIRFASILFSGILTALTIVPLLLSYNVPTEMALAIQAIIWFVYAAGIWQYVSGRSTQQLD